VADTGREPALVSGESGAVADLRDELAELRERVATIESRLDAGSG
jgi:hypothetical protein